MWRSYGKTRRRSSDRRARHRLFRHRLTGGPRRGGAFPGEGRRGAAFGGPAPAGWSSRGIMLSIEPVVAGPASRGLTRLGACGSLTDGIVFASLMALMLGGSVGDTEPSNMSRSPTAQAVPTRARPISPWPTSGCAGARAELHYPDAPPQLRKQGLHYPDTPPRRRKVDHRCHALGRHSNAHRAHTLAHAHTDRRSAGAPAEARVLHPRRFPRETDYRKARSVVSVGFSNQSGKFCNGIASSVRSETFVIHWNCSRRSPDAQAFRDHEASRHRL